MLDGPDQIPAPVSMQEVDGAPTPVLAAQPDQTQPPAAPAPVLSPAPIAPAAPAASPQIGQNKKHNIIGSIVGSFKDSGSGTSASQFWRSLIGGALVGMGAAENAPVVAHGPYGDIRDKSGAGAASRAWTAVQANIQQQQDRQRQQDQINKQNKQREFENKLQMDDLTLKKAADARAQQASIRDSTEFSKRMQVLDQNIAAGNFEATQRAATVAQQQVSFFNALQDVGAQPLQGSDGQPLTYGSLAEAEKAAHDNPKFFIGDFKTRTAYNPSTNKYEIYRVPDTDIKNVQLKDPVTGTMHTIPRMSANDYLEYMTRVQDLKKGALEIAKVSEEITRMRNDVKASSQYGEALKALTAATDKDGNVDLQKIPAGNRAVLVEHSAKGLEDALRARSGAIEKHAKAVEAGDQAGIDEANQNIEEATKIVKHYSGVLTTMTGGKPGSATAPPAQAPGAAPPKGQQMKSVDRTPFTSVESPGPRSPGHTIPQIPGQTPAQTNKIFQDLNAMQSPNDRAHYIAQLPIADTEKQKLKQAALKSEPKPAGQMTKMVVKGGQTLLIPPEDVDAVLADGGTFAE